MKYESDLTAVFDARERECSHVGDRLPMPRRRGAVLRFAIDGDLACSSARAARHCLRKLRQAEAPRGGAQPVRVYLGGRFVQHRFIGRRLARRQERWVEANYGRLAALPPF